MEEEFIGPLMQSIAEALAERDGVSFRKARAMILREDEGKLWEELIGPLLDELERRIRPTD